MMKILKIIFFLSILLITVGCKKTPKDINYYKSFKSVIDASFNGGSWKKSNWQLLGSYQDINPVPYTNLQDTANSLFCTVNEDRYLISISQFNESDELRETLFIQGISKLNKRFGVMNRVYSNCDVKDSLKVNFYTSQADGDVGKDTYFELNTKHNNYVEIKDYQPKRIKGEFDLALIMTRRRDVVGLIYPDTIKLKGTFDIKK